MASHFASSFLFCGIPKLEGKRKVGLSKQERGVLSWAALNLLQTSLREIFLTRNAGIHM